MKLKKTIRNDFDPRFEAGEIAGRLVGVNGLLEIYLFGSALTNKFSEDSDIDLMLIFDDMKSVEEANKQLSKTQLSLWPVKLVYKTKKGFYRRARIGVVCFDVVHEGVKLYESKSKAL